MVGRSFPALLWPRGRAAEMVPQGALTLGELRAALIRSVWAGATERGRENGGGKWCAEDDTMYSKVLRLDSLDL